MGDSAPSAKKTKADVYSLLNIHKCCPFCLKSVASKNEFLFHVCLPNTDYHENNKENIEEPVKELKSVQQYSCKHCNEGFQDQLALGVHFTTSGHIKRVISQGIVSRDVIDNLCCSGSLLKLTSSEELQSHNKSCVLSIEEDLPVSLHMAVVNFLSSLNHPEKVFLVFVNQQIQNSYFGNIMENCNYFKKTVGILSAGKGRSNIEKIIHSDLITVNINSLKFLIPYIIRNQTQISGIVLLQPEKYFDTTSYGFLTTYASLMNNGGKSCKIVHLVSDITKFKMFTTSTAFGFNSTDIHKNFH